jgi:hypothetical protein
MATTITVHFIEGSKSSACKNNAYAVVENGGNVVDIIPAAKDVTPAKIKEAFEKAIKAIPFEGKPKSDLRSNYARKILGL